MTEVEWMTCEDPRPMLGFLHGKASDRKLRLFALACFRPYRFMLIPEALQALEVAERLAEGVVSPDERKQARERAFHAAWSPDASLRHRRGPAKSCVASSLGRKAHEAASHVAHSARAIGVLSGKERGPGRVGGSAGMKEQETLQASLLREHFGNPFRPVARDPDWLNESVVDLARSIYEERAFEWMPLLGDALEGVGCCHEAVLTHCRGGMPHDRGCWVADWVLGKS